MKRILDCYSSDFRNMTRKDLLDSIAECEGRAIACETIGAIMPMLGDVTNAEFAAAMGADILLLNLFDVQKPHINGLPKCAPEDSAPCTADAGAVPLAVEHWRNAGIFCKVILTAFWFRAWDCLRIPSMQKP